MKRLRSEAVRAFASFFARYVPRPLPSWTGDALSAIAGIAALSRGLDLVTAPDIARSPTSVNVVVDLLGQHWWGSMILAAGLLVLSTLVIRRVGPLLMAHAFAAGVYLGYGIALLQGVVEQGGLTGWRFISTALTACAIHALRVITLGREVRQLAAEAETSSIPRKA